MSVAECVAVLEVRLDLCKGRVETADKHKHRINSAYHGGEVASLNFAIAQIQQIDQP